MRRVRLAVAIALFSGSALPFGIVRAQSAPPADSPLTAIEMAVACAPPPSIEVPSAALHVVGAQDTVARTLFEPRDLLVIDGGARHGIALGQKYYIRRPIFGGGEHKHPHGILTLGWLNVVALNETTAIGSIDHFCGGINAGDYLEPYARPVIPAGADRDDVTGELDFSTLGRVLSGIEGHSTIGIGNLLLIDRGADQGVEPGARFAIYRDQHTGGVPLTSVAEGVVLSIGKTMSLARLTRSRDAVVAGDFVVPRK